MGRMCQSCCATVAGVARGEDRHGLGKCSLRRPARRAESAAGGPSRRKKWGPLSSHIHSGLTGWQGQGNHLVNIPAEAPRASFAYRSLRRPLDRGRCTRRAAGAEFWDQAEVVDTIPLLERVWDRRLPLLPPSRVNDPVGLSLYDSGATEAVRRGNAAGAIGSGLVIVRGVGPGVFQ